MKHGIAPSDRVIGAVGRLDPGKRFDILIQVFAQLRRERPELQLVIAGDGITRQSLESIAGRLAPGAVRFTGHEADIVRFHHQLDLLVQSSESEGTPNAVLEAMALETPIVATDVGGTRELLRPGVDGLLVPPNDAQSLQRAIEAVLDDPAAAARRAGTARRRVERELSFEARMRAVESIYDELISARPRASLERATA
jgi:glycosyltransferase involved in cell wall biosynthesis